MKSMVLVTLKHGDTVDGRKICLTREIVVPVITVGARGSLLSSARYV